MRNYIARRLLLFIPTLVIISLLSFIISVNAPGDPVERMSAVSFAEGISGQQGGHEYWRRKLGLDLPVFYLSVRPLSEPRDLYLVADENDRETLRGLSWSIGNAESAVSLHASRKRLLKALETAGMAGYTRLKTATTPAAIASAAGLLHHPASGSIQNDANALAAEARSLQDNSFRYRNWLPAVSWHADNQYHRWIFGDGNWLTGNGSVHSKGIIRGDFGLSYLTRQPVSRVIGEKMGWSLFFSLASILLAYVVSVPLGVWAGARKGSRFDQYSSMALFLLYSIPAFWLATLLLMTFANPDVLHWFPASGVQPATGIGTDTGWWTRFSGMLPFLILPLVCYTYSSLAFLSRTLRATIADNMTQDYIRTAMAKGLPFGQVVFRHAFRNSLLPLITMFAHVFPAVIGGSVILETIFTIPGMGFEAFHSIQNQNYPMIVAIFTITGLLTMAGYLLSDILYALADPRISLHK
jgi:peptide/nickel transport system permease protein